MSAAQPSLLDGLTAGAPTPGTWVQTHGRQLTFDEIARRTGQIIILDLSSESHAWYRAVRVELIRWNPLAGCRRLVYDDGTRQHGLIDECYFAQDRAGAARAYLPA